MNSSLSCPSCGAPLERKYQYSKTIICGYCGQSSHLGTDKLLTAEGEKSPLTDYGSKISLQASLLIKDKRFEVLGRIRFAYPAGFWDEWFLRSEENPEKEYWLQEDEGTHILFQKEDTLSVNFSALSVGKTYKLFRGNSRESFIREKNTAQVKGGEGELPFHIIPGERADFADGIVIGRGQIVSIEFLPRETLLFSGEPIENGELKII